MTAIPTTALEARLRKAVDDYENASFAGQPYQRDVDLAAVARWAIPELLDTLSAAERERDEQTRLANLRGEEVAKWADASGTAKGQRDKLQRLLDTPDEGHAVTSHNNGNGVRIRFDIANESFQMSPKRALQLGAALIRAATKGQP
jgi:hypothetical protein